MLNKVFFSKNQLHRSFISTDRKSIISYIYDNEMPITYNTVYLIAEYLNGRMHDVRLFSTCSRIYYLSRLVYKGRRGFCKLSAEEYRRKLFEAHAGSTQEIYDSLVAVDRSYRKCSQETDNVLFEDLQKSYNIIKTIWCKSLACISEQIYIPEIAYAFEYIVDRKGNLPQPEIQEGLGLFPSNYVDYDYTEGVAKRFEEEMISIF